MKGLPFRTGSGQGFQRSNPHMSFLMSTRGVSKSIRPEKTALKRLPGNRSTEVNEVMRFSRIGRHVEVASVKLIIPDSEK